MGKALPQGLGVFVEPHTMSFAARGHSERPRAARALGQVKRLAAIKGGSQVLSSAHS